VGTSFQHLFPLQPSAVKEIGLCEENCILTRNDKQCNEDAAISATCHILPGKIMGQKQKDKGSVSLRWVNREKERTKLSDCYNKKKLEYM